MRNLGIVGMARSGTYAEKITLPWQSVWPKPAYLSFEEAAALPLAYLTAWRLVMTKLAVQPGQTVLIHGIGGGVALAALQWVKLIGGRAIVTSSSVEKLARAKEIGAFAGIDYKAHDVAAAAKGLTGGEGVDAVVDTVGGATIPISIEAARRGGKIACCGVTGGAEAPLNVQKLYWHQISLLGSTLGSDSEFQHMLRAAEVNELRPVIDAVMPLDQARKAMQRMEDGGQFGKIVLSI